MKKQKQRTQSNVVQLNRQNASVRPDEAEYSESQDNEQFYRSVNRHQILNRISACLLLVAVVALLWYQFIYKTSKAYSGVKEVWSEEIVTVSSQKYLNFSDGILQYSNNGVTYYGSEGKLLWTNSYEMVNPIISSNGGYAVIYDEASTKAVIVSKDGYTGSLTTANPITKATVSQYGAVALMTEDALANDILFYDKAGKQLEVRIHTRMEESGYPMDISFSPDGQMLIASFMYIDSGVMQNQIVFYNFNEGKMNTGRTVGAFRKYGDTLFADVEFLSDDRAVAFGDGKVVLYSLRNKTSPQELAVIEPENVITNICYSRDYIAFATMNGDLVQSRRLYVYNTNGEQIFSGETTFEFDKMLVNKNGIYLNGASTLCYMTLKGKLAYVGSLDCNILQFNNGKRANDLVVVTDRAIKYMKLVRD